MDLKLRLLVNQYAKTGDPSTAAQIANMLIRQDTSVWALINPDSRPVGISFFPSKILANKAYVEESVLDPQFLIDRDDPFTEDPEWYDTIIQLYNQGSYIKAAAILKDRDARCPEIREL